MVLRVSVGLTEWVAVADELKVVVTVSVVDMFTVLPTDEVNVAFKVSVGETVCVGEMLILKEDEIWSVISRS